MKERFEEFFKRYDTPEVEALTVGYSGVDPPLKPNSYWLDHECLDNLMGGEDEGHYHITKEQLKGLQERFDKDYQPRILPKQLIDAVPNDEMTPYKIKGIHINKTV